MACFLLIDYDAMYQSCLSGLFSLVGVLKHPGNLMELTRQILTVNKHKISHLDSLNRFHKHLLVFKRNPTGKKRKNVGGGLRNGANTRHFSANWCHILQQSSHRYCALLMHGLTRNLRDHERPCGLRGDTIVQTNTVSLLP